MINFKNKKTIAERTKANQLRPCVNCGRQRHKLGRFCVTCNNKRYEYGDPNGRAIPRTYYISYINDCKRLIDGHRDNRGVQWCLKFCSDFLEKASNGSMTVPNPKQRIGFLFIKGVTARELLVEAAAMYCYLKRNPRPGFNYQIGNAVLRLRRWNRRIYGSHRKEVGNYLLTRLEPLFKKLHETVKNEKDNQVRLEAALEENWG